MWQALGSTCQSRWCFIFAKRLQILFSFPQSRPPQFPTLGLPPPAPSPYRRLPTKRPVRRRAARPGTHMRRRLGTLQTRSGAVPSRWPRAAAGTPGREPHRAGGSTTRSPLHVLHIRRGFHRSGVIFFVACCSNPSRTYSFAADVRLIRRLIPSTGEPRPVTGPAAPVPSARTRRPVSSISVLCQGAGMREHTNTRARANHRRLLLVVCAPDEEAAPWCSRPVPLPSST